MGLNTVGPDIGDHELVRSAEFGMSLAMLAGLRVAARFLLLVVVSPAGRVVICHLSGWAVGQLMPF